MNFFEHQDEARKNTGRLVGLFVLAVIGIILSLYVVAMIGYSVVQANGAYNTGNSYADPYGYNQQYGTPYQAPGVDDGKNEEGGGFSASRPVFEISGVGIYVWDPRVFFGVAFFVSLTIGLGSFVKIRQLRGGGASVAASVGGRLLNPDTTDQDERKLLNVVEEMSIASGVPVPLVFVMDNEAGINAFAAGYTINDAAVAVTDGCMRRLTRDELQGVVAHEFSHILNGDMRLNIRLIGVLFGILVIGNTGLWLLRMAMLGGGRSRRGNPLPLIAIGAVLAGIGFIGVFFGRLIKAAVSRQREYLADASAVQFTRNPDGLAGALKKIGGFNSKVDARQASDLSHMFFSNALAGGFLNSALATHPPLQERVSRIDRNFKQQMQQAGGIAAQAGPSPSGDGRSMGFAGGGGAAPMQSGAPGANPSPLSAAPKTMRINPNSVVGQVGAVSAQHLSYSSSLLNSIPPELREATHQLLPAVGIIYGLLLDDSMEIREKQLEMLRQVSHPDIVRETMRGYARVRGVDGRARLPLVELCCPTLRQLVPAQYAQFQNEVRMLVDADDQVTVFEFAMEKVILHRLDETFGSGTRGRVRHHSFQNLVVEARLLLSQLAYVGANSPQEAVVAYNAGTARLPDMMKQTTLLPQSECSFDKLGVALDKLVGAAPSLKQMLVEATAHTVLADEEVTLEEAELLRTIVNAFDCPMPPFLA